MNQRKVLLQTIGMMIVLLPLVACGAPQPTSTQESPTATPVPPTDVPPPPTDVPPPPTETAIPPTNTPEPTPAPVQITSAEELHGGWRYENPGTNWRGRIVFNEDGSMQLTWALGPVFWGEYWFEDEIFHIRTLGQMETFDGILPFPQCDPAVIGEYEVILKHDGELSFIAVSDECSGSASRQYILTIECDFHR